MKKYIVILIIVVVLALGAYFIKSMRVASNPSTSTVSTSTTSVGTTSTSTSTSTSTIEYTNNQYGFNFTLPSDWQGYTIVTENWSGMLQNPANPSAMPASEQGPELLIRNPHWTATEHWQDIPIMVFTPAQWAQVSAGNLAVSAAPIGPSELGSNNKYVFALPARYNYAFPQGWQEVQTIMQSNPLQGFN